MKISERMSSSNRSGWIGLSFFLLLIVLPPLIGTLYAMLNSVGVVGFAADGLTWNYWFRVVLDSEVWLSILFTFYVSLCTIGCTIILSLTLALILKNELQHGLPGYAIYAPLAFPAIVVAFLVLQVASESGLFSRILFQTGWITSSSSFPNFVHDPYGIGIISAHVFMAVPFFTIYFIHLYGQHDIERYKHVGKTLGANSNQQVRRIAIPMLLKSASPTLILYSIFILGSYEIPLILGQQHPQMVSVLIIRKLRRYNLETIPEAFVTTVLFILVITAILSLLFASNLLNHDSKD